MHHYYAKDLFTLQRLIILDIKSRIDNLQDDLHNVDLLRSNESMATRHGEL